MRTKLIIRLAAVALVTVAIILTWKWFDSKEWLDDLLLLAGQPGWLLFMYAVYLLSFVLKAAAWRAYAGPQLRFGIFYHSIIYSLLVNHLLPIKAGDAVRTGLFMKYTGKPWDEALHSVAVMRLLDMLVLGTIGALGIVHLGLPTSWLWISVLIGGTLVLAVAHYFPLVRKIPFVSKHAAYFQISMLSRKGFIIIGLVTASWVLEAGIVFAVVRILAIQLSPAALVWANSITIAGQIFHITPGAIGTYESTMSGSLVLLGVGGKDAFRAALLSHTFKFVFAYSVGACSLFFLPLQWTEIKRWLKLAAGRKTGKNHSLDQQQETEG